MIHAFDANPNADGGNARMLAAHGVGEASQYLRVTGHGQIANLFRQIDGLQLRPRTLLLPDDVRYARIDERQHCGDHSNRNRRSQHGRLDM